MSDHDDALADGSWACDLCPPHEHTPVGPAVLRPGDTVKIVRYPTVAETGRILTVAVVHESGDFTPAGSPGWRLANGSVEVVRRATWEEVADTVRSYGLKYGGDNMHERPEHRPQGGDAQVSPTSSDWEASWARASTLGPEAAMVERLAVAVLGELDISHASAPTEAALRARIRDVLNGGR